MALNVKRLSLCLKLSLDFFFYEGVVYDGVFVYLVMCEIRVLVFYF